MAKIKIVATNNIFSDWIDKEFEAEAQTNGVGSHLFKLKSQTKLKEEIYFDKNSRFYFTKNGLLLEGFAQIGFSIGQLSILIYETV